MTPARQLMVIVPDDGGFKVEARIENKDVGFVQTGQPLNYQSTVRYLGIEVDDAIEIAEKIDI